MHSVYLIKFKLNFEFIMWQSSHVGLVSPKYFPGYSENYNFAVS